MNNFKAGWYAIYTRPRHEKKVAEHLSGFGIDHLLPLIKKLRTWNDRLKYIDSPLFPSYIFVHISDKIDYFNTLDISGVLNFVKMGNELVRVNRDVIDSIKLLVEKQAAIEVCDGNFLPGQPLVICKGPLTGLHCEVVNHNNKSKLLVRISLLRRSILVTTKAEALIAI